MSEGIRCLGGSECLGPGSGGKAKDRGAIYYLLIPLIMKELRPYGTILCRANLKIIVEGIADPYLEKKCRKIC
jgi:hypothetical protein